METGFIIIALIPIAAMIFKYFIDHRGAGNDLRIEVLLGQIKETLVCLKELERRVEVHADIITDELAPKILELEKRLESNTFPRTPDIYRPPIVETTELEPIINPHTAKKDKDPVDKTKKTYPKVISVSRRFPKRFL